MLSYHCVDFNLGLLYFLSRLKASRYAYSKIHDRCVFKMTFPVLISNRTFAGGILSRIIVYRGGVVVTPRRGESVRTLHCYYEGVPVQGYVQERWVYWWCSKYSNYILYFYLDCRKHILISYCFYSAVRGSSIYVQSSGDIDEYYGPIWRLCFFFEQTYRLTKAGGS